MTTAREGRLGALLGLRPTARGRTVHGPVWLGLSSLVTGAATYLLLILLARVIGAIGYADFAVFWSFLVIVSFGVFLPVEQDVARRVAGEPGSVNTVLRGAVVVALAYAAVLVVVAGILWVTLLRSRPDPAMVVALVLLCIAEASQFCARGVLSGQVRLPAYATVVGSDAVLRLATVAGLALLGVRSPGAFALAVALSAAVAAALGWALLLRRTAAMSVLTSRDRPDRRRTRLLRSTGGLIVGALGMQLLLNGGTLVARGLASQSEAALAGHLLATMTLARVPVFLLQSMQASYLARVARQARERDHASLLRTLRLLGGLALALAVATPLGAFLIGPELIRVVYGESFAISREAGVLVALGVGCYVIGSVSNDVAVALGRHGTVAGAWLVAVTLGVATTWLAGTLVEKSTLPLVIGATVAAALLVTRIASDTRRIGA